MKILLVSGIFPPDSGGPANYVPAIARALAREHEVMGVITLSDRLDHDDDPYGFPVLRIERRQNRLLRRVRTIASIAKLARRADVVYLNGLVLEGVVATRLLSRRPAVVKVVGDLVWEHARNCGATAMDLDEFQRPGGKAWYWEVLRALQSRYTAAADLVLTPSMYLRGVVCGWGVPADRVRVVHNAVELAGDTTPDVTPDHDVVTAARLVPWKGIDRLIRVCAANGWRLLVVGDGPSRQSLENESRRSGASVTFAGQVAKDAVPALIRRGRVFVLNSMYEGLPHIVLEAKLSGRPVVASAVGGTPETIRDGVDGLLVKPGDDSALGEAIRRLLQDDDFRQRIASTGRRDASVRFSFQRMYEETVDVLQDAVRLHG